MKDINLLASILSLGNQEDKKSFLINHFKTYEQKHDAYGNLYISRDFSKTQPFVCSHIDTVDESLLSKTVIYDETSGILTAERDGIQCNLGADDGVGVWACLELFKQHDVSLAFFLDEEVGCIGSSNADSLILENASYLIQLDRKGNDDIVFKTHNTFIASPSFMAEIIPLMPKYGYKGVNGGLTDVVTLVERGIASISACNISCGYYKPHSQEEYIIIEDMNELKFTPYYLKRLF